MKAILRRGGKTALILDDATGEVEVGEAVVSASGWAALNKRVEAVLRRKGLIKPPGSAPAPVANSFVIANIQQINKTKRGRLKKAPWPLSFLYDSVVTKEELK